MSDHTTPSNVLLLLVLFPVLLVVLLVMKPLTHLRASRRICLRLVLLPVLQVVVLLVLFTVLLVVLLVTKPLTHLLASRRICLRPAYIGLGHVNVSPKSATNVEVSM